jgi:hypothetical protein
VTTSRIGWILRGAISLVAVTSLWLSAGRANADDPDWPRQFDTSSGSFVIYQPQPEDLQGDVLYSRAAFSLRKTRDATPVFGVLWYTEHIAIDRDSSTVTARAFDVTKVRLPGITPEEASRYEALVENEAAGWDLSGSVEELKAGLAASERERESVAGLVNTPPKIVFHERRSILVVYDGAPDFDTIQGSELLRALNTPYAVVFDPRDRNYYLNGANLWYQARNALGPWTNIDAPPPSVREVVPPDTSAADQVNGPPPEVLTATEPTELIASDGPPQYASLVSDQLLYMSNTESDVILEVSTQNLYVLLSGRWFRAPSQDGPWTYVRGDSLPQSFALVPPDSPKGNILASVAGTDQAEDAVADAEIPQTSAIHRDDHGFRVAYDGKPRFEPIEGTNLEYAVNTDAEIILDQSRYYACDQGVWYVSLDPMGPWDVSDREPAGLDAIPPSSPVYDVRYVYVYDYTPDVVYVGYLPGYLGCYPYYGTVYYGTGYHYRPWRSRDHYYPSRFTWGFHARYNPWLSRWSFGFSYSTGFIRTGTRWRPAVAGTTTRTRSAWFGPGGYRRPLVAADMGLLRTRPRQRTRTSVADVTPTNLYNRTDNVARVDPRAVLTPRINTIARPVPTPAPVPNDVFAGQDGKVYRRDPQGGWQVRSGKNWTKTNTPSANRESNGAFVQHPMPQPIHRPVEQPTSPPDRSKSSQQERPATQNDRQPPQHERPPRAQEHSRPSPPPDRSTPGNLEREFRARQRAREEAPAPQTKAPQQHESPFKAKNRDVEKAKDQPKAKDDAKAKEGGQDSK